MLLLAADENLTDKLIRGLRRLYRWIETLCVQDAELRAADDSAVLEWAAASSAARGPPQRSDTTLIDRGTARSPALRFRKSL